MKNTCFILAQKLKKPKCERSNHSKNYFVHKKSLFFFVLFAFIALDVFSQNYSIIGKWGIFKWSEIDNPEAVPAGIVDFKKDNTFSSQGNVGKYVLNNKYLPHYIDVIRQDGQEKVTLIGIYEWVDNNTLKVQINRQEGDIRPSKFSSYECSVYRRLSANGEIIKTKPKEDIFKSQLIGKWDITLLYEADKYIPGKKYQTYTFQSDNRYLLGGTDFIPGSSGSGRYELNSSKFPYWIDFYPDGGSKTLGLIQAYLSGYKLEVFDPVLYDGHPTQFSDVEYRMPEMINSNPRFLYLERSTDSQESVKGVESANKTKPGEVVSNDQANKPKENADITQIIPILVKASSTYPPDNSTYEPSFTIDNNKSTAWFPNTTNKSNSGQWIKFSFAQLATITEIGIVNGWAKTDNLWSSNSRVKDLKIDFSNGNVKTIRLEDIKSRQSISCNEIGVAWVTLTIQDCYTGSTIEAGLTEVDFKGSAGKASITNQSKSVEVENLGPNVNTKYEELFPKISADGKMMYFIVTEHPQNNKYGIKKLAQDIWYSEKGSDGEWGKATHAPYPLNQDAYNGVNWVSPDGNRILINGFYENGKYKGIGISLCSKDKNGWSVPIGQKIKNYEKMALGKYSSTFMADDAKTLILSFSKAENSLIQNLYYSQLVSNGYWSEPKSLGSLFEGSNYIDFDPFLASDGVTLFFSSDRPGGMGSHDIWMCRRLDDTWQNWSEPVNLGFPINSPGFESGFSVDATGEYGYMVSSDKSYGNTDIVRVRLGEKVKPKPVVLLYGNVYNSKTKEPLSASLLYESLPDGKNAGNAYSSPVDGSYKLVLPYGKNYSFRATAGNFIPVSENLDLMKASIYKEIRKDLYLVPIEKGQTIRLNSIFFDFGKAALRTESFPELDRLLSIMQENPKLKIEISGHTDNVGNDADNLKLSGERANAVMTYLNNKGIPVNRISTKGYGKTKPFASNDTEEGRQLNRRVEFTILEN